jgi:hypothetical protein
METPGWPDWWDWNFEISGYAAKRMRQRDVYEAEVRAMLVDATAIKPAKDPGGRVVTTSKDESEWKIVLEPDESRSIIEVVTVYKVE